MQYDLKEALDKLAIEFQPCLIFAAAITSVRKGGSALSARHVSNRPVGEPFDHATYKLAILATLVNDWKLRLVESYGVSLAHVEANLRKQMATIGPDNPPSG